MPPIEVIIRQPKTTGEDFTVSLLTAVFLLALKAFVIFLVTPGVFSVFGMNVHPNYGEAMLMALLAGFLFARPGVPYKRAGSTTKTTTKEII